MSQEYDKNGVGNTVNNYAISACQHIVTRLILISLKCTEIVIFLDYVTGTNSVVGQIYSRNKLIEKEIRGGYQR